MSGGLRRAIAAGLAACVAAACQGAGKPSAERAAAAAPDPLMSRYDAWRKLERLLTLVGIRRTNI